MDIWGDIGAGALLGGPGGAITGGVTGGANDLFGQPLNALGDMFGGGTPMGSTSLPYWANGPTEATNFGVGNSQFGLWNPGNIDPALTNPYASHILGNEEGLYNQFSKSAAGGAFNPDFYQHMQDVSQNNLTTQMGNQYARMGLGGSSAELGGMSQALQQNQMGWMNRQQSDQMKALQGLGGLNSQMYGQTMGIQGQYGNFQDTNAQDILSMYGMGQQAQMANNQMTGQLLGSGIGALGTYAGMAAMA